MAKEPLPLVWSLAAICHWMDSFKLFSDSQSSGRGSGQGKGAGMWRMADCATARKTTAMRQPLPEIDRLFQTIPPPPCSVSIDSQSLKWDALSCASTNTTRRLTLLGRAPRITYTQRPLKSLISSGHFAISKLFRPQCKVSSRTLIGRNRHCRTLWLHSVKFTQAVQR